MSHTPINNGLAQSDLDLANFKPVRANLSDYAGTGLDWNTGTKQFDASGGGGGGGGGLDENTVTAEDIGLVGDGVTDNTVAFQAWLTSVGAAKENITLLVPDGVYIFGGALQDTSRRNAQILLPSADIADRSYSVTIQGYHSFPYIPWPAVSMAIPQGPIFKSTLATGGGTDPSFIGGMGPAGGAVAPNLSFMGICFKDMVFQTVANPLISCLNLSHYSVVGLLGDILVVAGNGIGSLDTTQPTTATSYGVRMPLFNQGTVQRADNLNVCNFYTGVKAGELTHIVNMMCEMCIYALEFPFSYHITLIERIVDWWCTNGINMTASHPFQVQQYDVERGDPALWYTRVNDVNDPSNYAIADITWWTVQGGVGAIDAFTINGGTGINARRGGGPIYIGKDARMVAVSGGVKLEARNTGTGTWVEAARWTNP